MGHNCNTPFTFNTILNASNPRYVQEEAQKHWMMIGGIVAAGMFAIVLFLTVAIVIRRYRQHKTEQLSYTYTQLTADLADPDAPEMEALIGSDDDKMIIGWSMPMSLKLSSVF